jgi:hypothetical protein
MTNKDKELLKEIDSIIESNRQISRKAIIKLGKKALQLYCRKTYYCDHCILHVNNECSVKDDEDNVPHFYEL